MLEGSLLGLVTEVGEAAENGNLDAFLSKVGGAELDHSRLPAKRIATNLTAWGSDRCRMDS